MREIPFRHDSGTLPPSLRKVPFLRGLDAGVSEKLMAESVLLECDPGDTIIIEGDESKFFCILLRGVMDVVKDGKNVNRISHPGEMLGELALITDSRRSASVVAAAHSFCLKVEPKFLEGLNDAERNGFYAQLYQFVTKILGERLDDSSKRIVGLEKKIQELSGVVPSDGTTDPEDQPGVYRL